MERREWEGVGSKQSEAVTSVREVSRYLVLPTGNSSNVKAFSCGS